MQSLFMDKPSGCMFHMSYYLCMYARVTLIFPFSTYKKDWKNMKSMSFLLFKRGQSVLSLFKNYCSSKIAGGTAYI